MLEIAAREGIEWGKFFCGRLRLGVRPPRLEGLRKRASPDAVEFGASLHFTRRELVSAARGATGLGVENPSRCYRLLGRKPWERALFTAEDINRRASGCLPPSARHS